MVTIDQNRVSEQTQTLDTWPGEDEWIKQHRQNYATTPSEAKGYEVYRETQRDRRSLCAAAEKSDEEQKAHQLSASSHAHFYGFSFSALSGEMEAGSGVVTRRIVK